MKRWLKCVLAVSLFGGAAFLLFLFHPGESGFFPACPAYKWTGLYCSGCGSLRSIHYLLQGQLAEAWSMNPLTVMLLPFIFLLATAELFFKKYSWANRVRPHWIWALAAIFLLFGVLRNLPFEPFCYLAPH